MSDKVIWNIVSNMKTNYRVKNKYAKIKYKKQNLRILFFLKKYGYIVNYKINYKRKYILIGLKYINFKPLIIDFIKFKITSNRKQPVNGILKTMMEKNP